MLKYIICLGLIPYVASARIGETLEQCERRYGPSTALKIDAETAVYSFTKGPFSIAATIWKGTVHNLLISKRSENAPTNSQKLTEVELQTFFQANRGESPWAKIASDKNYEYWELADQSRRAVYELKTQLLMFTTKDYGEKSTVDKAAREKAVLKDF